MLQKQIDTLFTSMQALQAQMDVTKEENKSLRFRIGVLEREVTRLTVHTSRLNERTKDSIRFGF